MRGALKTKNNNADPTLSSNQDKIIEGVILTRGNRDLLYNVAVENGASNGSPSGTLWAEGTTENLKNLTFTSLKTAANNQMKNVPGKSFVLYIPEHRIYLDVTFNS